MSGRCRSHLYSRAMQAGSRGVCVRCGEAEPLRGIISDPHPVEDAFDPGPSAYLRPRLERDALFRRLDEMLGYSSHGRVLSARQMARELYDDGA